MLIPNGQGPGCYEPERMNALVAPTLARICTYHSPVCALAAAVSWHIDPRARAVSGDRPAIPDSGNLYSSGHNLADHAFRMCWSFLL